MGLAEGTAEDSEILAEDEDKAAIDRAMAGDDTVAGDLLVAHAEVTAPVLDEHVPFLEGTGIGQKIDALARSKPALGMLGIGPALAATGPRRRPLQLKLPQNLAHIRPRPTTGRALPIAKSAGGRQPSA